MLAKEAVLLKRNVLAIHGEIGPTLKTIFEVKASLEEEEVKI